MRRAKTLLLSGVLAVTIFMAGCTKNAMGEEKVATVDGAVITKTEYQETYDDFLRELNVDLDKLAQAQPQQKAMVEETLKQMTLNKLILQTLIENAAKKQNISVSAEDIAAFKEQELFAKNPGVKEQFPAYLQQRNMTEAEFDEMVKENLMLERFIEKNAAGQTTVSDTELKAFYEQYKQQLQMPEQIKARHILVKANEQVIKKEMREANPSLSEDELAKAAAAEMAKRKAEAEKLLKDVTNNPAKFAELAKQHSDDPASGKAGGELGYLMEGTTDPDFWKAVDVNPVGKLVPHVVTTQFGYHIVGVQEHKPPHVQSYEEASDKLRKFISDQKKQAWLQQWANQQKAASAIVIEEAYQPKQQQQQPAGNPTAPANAPGSPIGNVQPQPQGQQ